MTRRKGRTCLLLQRVTCTKPSCVATTWRLGSASMEDCQFAHGRKELRKYSLRVYSNDSWVEQRQQCTTRFLFRGHFTIVLLTGMTALTEDEDISEAIMLKPLPLVVRRASQSANTNTSNNAPFTLSAAALHLSCVLLRTWRK